MKNLPFLAMSILLITALSCKKTTEDTKVELLNNFQPMTSGSSWTYTDYPQTNVYSQYITGMDSTFGGKKYREMMNTQSGISWCRKEGGSYYTLYSNGNQKIELLTLKEDVPKGTGWEVDFTANGFNNRLLYVLMEYDVPKIVYGNIYKHCMNVRVESFVDFGSGDSLMSTVYYTYANKVGLIYVERGDQNKTYLSNYKIN